MNREEYFVVNTQRIKKICFAGMYQLSCFDQ